MKYLDYPIGTIMTMQINPDYRNPKRWFCQEVRLLLWYGWGEGNTIEARRKLRTYYFQEGISFQFRYY